MEHVKEYHHICVSRREELQKLSTGDLFRRAALLDVGGQELDAAYSAVDPKAFLVELVLHMDEDSRLVSGGVAGLRADAERSMQELQQRLIDSERRGAKLLDRIRADD